jgi:AbrB family looped-hinge helix DNA binding protein
MAGLARRTRLRIGKGGRLVIPASMRKRLRLEVGAEILLTETGRGHLELTTPEAAFDEAQDAVCQVIGPDVSLVDELLSERREEALRDE